ncbi:MAG: ATP-binding protein [Spirochaetales bacterium]|nr:ATP-binding protein [Spirochaetales bacterium]
MINDLKKWKNSSYRKPLIIEGARQVGKTWLLKEFGRLEYNNTVYINCDHNTILDDLFVDYDSDRIIRNLSAISGQPIKPNETLIIFDEIQEFPQALTSLKYFCENAGDYHIAVAGSLLGLQMHSGTGYPVGKVDILNLYPLSFMEFLDAMGENMLTDYIRTHKWEEMNALNSRLKELLRQYYFVGGMPEVVANYVQNHDILQVRQLQHNILDSYEKDISKHASANDIQKINMVWHAIPSQLAKENKKYIYGAIKKGGRAKEFENAIQWLLDAGLVHKINRVKKLEMPIKFYEDFECFKLFMNDLGLLGAMADAPAAGILIGDNIFSEYKGSFTEQFVAQQYFTVYNRNLFYYTNENSTMEFDFVMQTDKVYPI